MIGDVTGDGSLPVRRSRPGDAGISKGPPLSPLDGNARPHPCEAPSILGTAVCGAEVKGGEERAGNRLRRTAGTRTRRVGGVSRRALLAFPRAACAAHGISRGPGMRRAAENTGRTGCRLSAHMGLAPCRFRDRQRARNRPRETDLMPTSPSPPWLMSTHRQSPSHSPLAATRTGGLSFTDKNTIQFITCMYLQWLMLYLFDNLLPFSDTPGHNATARAAIRVRPRRSPRRPAVPLPEVQLTRRAAGPAARARYRKQDGFHRPGTGVDLAPRQARQASGAPAQARRPPAATSTARRCPGRYPSVSVPCSPKRPPCRSAGATTLLARSRDALPSRPRFSPCRACSRE